MWTVICMERFLKVNRYQSNEGVQIDYDHLDEARRNREK